MLLKSSLKKCHRLKTKECIKMSDVTNAYEQIVDFLNNETEKTLLLRGIADKEKHLSLLKALNAQGKRNGLINLIHTSKDGMEEFFRWAELYKVQVQRNTVRR